MSFLCKNIHSFNKTHTRTRENLHISNTYINEIKDHLSEGQEVKVKVISIDEKGRISLSIKKAIESSAATTSRNHSSQPASYNAPQRKVASFEDMLLKFKQDTDEKFSDVKGQKESRKANYEKRSRNRNRRWIGKRKDHSGAEYYHPL